jgi:hypothetical protein
MFNNLPFLPIEIQNIIFSYTRPVYPFIKELKEKVEKYIDFYKGFGETLLIWAREDEEDKDEKEYLDNMRLYEKTLEKINLNINIKPRPFIKRNF